MRTTANQLSAPDAPARFGWVDLLVISTLFALLAGILKFARGMIAPFHQHDAHVVDLSELNIPYYAGRTLLRMWIAYALALLFTIVVGYVAAKSKRARFFILPALDILQSVPVLAFQAIAVAPFIALFPGSLFGVECAAIFSIFTAQVWNMTFGFYHSLVTIPTDLQEAGQSYGLNRFRRFIKIELPAAAHSLIWNSMMSFGGGWFFVAQSEAITVMDNNIQLDGLGSYMAAVVQAGNFRGAALAVLAMVILIIASDQLIWRPLIAWADKFKVQLTDSNEQPSSWVLNLIRRSYAVAWVSERVSIFLEDTFHRFTKLVPPAAQKEITPGQKFVRALLCYSVDEDGRAIYYYGVFEKLTFFYTYLVYFICVSFGLYLLYVMFEGLVDVHDHVPVTEIYHIIYLGILTLLRVTVMTIVATIIWTPVGVWIGSHPKAANLFQPIAQILASFPTNMTFPVVVSVFIFAHIDINYGSIFLIAMGTQWYILFNVIAGASAIPNDLKEAGRTFGMTGVGLWRRLIIPAIFPFWVTGACTAAGGAWNASIVAEVATWGNTTLTADGLGAYIKNVTGTGDVPRIICSVVTMSLMVVVINKLVWRRLYDLAERRYRLD